MNDTPRTDAFIGLAKDWSDFARQLESENAVLREAFRKLVDREFTYLNGHAEGITLSDITDARLALAKATT